MIKLFFFSLFFLWCIVFTLNFFKSKISKFGQQVVPFINVFIKGNNYWIGILQDLTLYKRECSLYTCPSSYCSFSNFLCLITLGEWCSIAKACLEIWPCLCCFVIIYDIQIIYPSNLELAYEVYIREDYVLN